MPDLNELARRTMRQQFETQATRGLEAMLRASPSEGFNDLGVMESEAQRAERLRRQVRSGQGEQFISAAEPEWKKNISNILKIARSVIAPQPGDDPAYAADFNPAGQALQAASSLIRGAAKPTYKSVLKETLERPELPNVFTPKMLKQLVDKLPSQGVKPEELKWSGLSEWVQKAQRGTGKISKQELINLVDENTVEITELTGHFKDAPIDKWRESMGMSVRDSDFKPKYDSYTLYDSRQPRDVNNNREISNYREVLLQQGGSEKYQTHHWDEKPNILAHMRLSDRQGPKNQRLLFVEEIQSDWHQARDTVRKRTLAELKDPTNTPEDIEDLQRSLIDNTEIPDAPFEKFEDLALKRIMRMAAEEGYDGIAWTTGKQQVERYNNNANDYFEGLSGMEVFYDKRLPASAQRVGKPWNVKPTKTQINLGDRSEEVHYIPLTSSMREGAQKPFPLFEVGGVGLGLAGVAAQQKAKVDRRNQQQR